LKHKHIFYTPNKKEESKTMNTFNIQGFLAQYSEHSAWHSILMYRTRELTREKRTEIPLAGFKLSTQRDMFHKLSEEKYKFLFILRTTRTITEETEPEVSLIIKEMEQGSVFAS